MQILITVEDGGAATAQVLGSVPIQETTAFTAEPGEAVIDGGAAPNGEENAELDLVAPALEVETEAQDGGAAPPEVESDAESMVSMEPLLEVVPPSEAEGAFDAGAAPTIQEPASDDSATSPTLRIVD